MNRYCVLLLLCSTPVWFACGCTSTQDSRTGSVDAGEPPDDGGRADAADAVAEELGPDSWPGIDGAEEASDSAGFVDVFDAGEVLVTDGSGDGDEGDGGCMTIPCVGFTYCDQQTRGCKPGCVDDPACGVDHFCRLPTHTCHASLWTASITTSLGTIVLELNAKKAPVTVENFGKYAEAKFYDGLIFHRVIAGFMIQGGGMYPDMTQKDTLFPAIANEAASAGLLNKRGTIAMARTFQPDSAQSQFFINVADNPNLDPSEEKAGYCVFGRVVEGMAVVDEIEQVPTHTVGSYADVPRKPVVIESLVVTEE